jgi:hypothetical protein
MTALTLPRLALLGLALVATPAAADFSQTFSGSNVNGPTWNRPIDDGPSLRETDQQPYSAQRFNLAGPARCRISSTQEGFDGYIHLYADSFDPTSPLTNLVGGDDDHTNDPSLGLGVGTSLLPDPDDLPDEPSLELPAGDYVIVTSGFGANDQGSFTTYVQCNDARIAQGTCFFVDTPRENQVCLQDRFAVRIRNVTNSATGVGTPVRFGSTDSAFFWFFGDQNFEVVVKVLDACVLNSRFWVFAAGLTDQGYRIEVGDSLTGEIRPYTNTLGQRAPATTDTNAFACNL